MHKHSAHTWHSVCCEKKMPPVHLANDKERRRFNQNPFTYNKRTKTHTHAFPLSIKFGFKIPLSSSHINASKALSTTIIDVLHIQTISVTEEIDILLHSISIEARKFSERKINWVFFKQSSNIVYFSTFIYICIFISCLFVNIFRNKLPISYFVFIFQMLQTL